MRKICELPLLNFVTWVLLIIVLSLTNFLEPLLEIHLFYLPLVFWCILFLTILQGIPILIEYIGYSKAGRILFTLAFACYFYLDLLWLLFGPFYLTPGNGILVTITLILVIFSLELIIQWMWIYLDEPVVALNNWIEEWERKHPPKEPAKTPSAKKAFKKLLPLKADTRALVEKLKRQEQPSNLSAPGSRKKPYPLKQPAAKKKIPKKTNLPK